MFLILRSKITTYPPREKYLFSGEWSLFFVCPNDNYIHLNMRKKSRIIPLSLDVKYKCRKRRRAMRHRLVNDDHSNLKKKLLISYHEDVDTMEKAIKCMEIFRLQQNDPTGGIFQDGIKRKYPLAEETYRLYGFDKTVDFIFENAKFFPRILEPPQGEVCSTMIYELTMRDRAKTACVVLSVTDLLSRVAHYVAENPATLVPSFFSSPRAMSNHMAANHISSNVFVCLSHRTHIHVCSTGICQNSTRTESGMMVCPISRKQTESVDADIFENACVNGMKTSVRVVTYSDKRFFGKKQGGGDIVLCYDGKKLEMDIASITRRYHSVSNSIISIQDLKRFIDDQKKLFSRLKRDGVMYVDTVICSGNKKKKKKTKRNATTKDNKVKKTSVLSKRRKTKKRRRSRRQINGQFDKATTDKMYVSNSVQKNRSFATEKRNFVRMLKMVIDYSAVNVIEPTHFINLIGRHRESSEGDHSVYAFINERDKASVCESFFLDPHPLQWCIPWEKETLCTTVKKPVMFYLSFLLTEDIKTVIEKDFDHELSLRSILQPRLRNAPDDFLAGLSAKIYFIRRLTPGLFRLIMMFRDIMKSCSDRYTALKTMLQNRHTQNRTPSDEDIRPYVRMYNFRRNYLHTTCTDNFLLEIAELFYWFEKMCELHPMYTQKKHKDLTSETIWVGLLYWSQSGLPYDCYRMLIPKNVILCRRNVLTPQNRLGMIKIDRKDVSKGMMHVKSILRNLCIIYPVDKIAFPMWKATNTVLVPISEFSDESLIIETEDVD